jgi:hypothetical protein
MYMNKILQKKKLYNTIFLKRKKNDNQIITMDTKDIDKLQIYIFINVTHIIHKLFQTLTTSKLTLSLLTYATKILILLFCCIFLSGKIEKNR